MTSMTVYYFQYLTIFRICSTMEVAFVRRAVLTLTYL